MHSTKYLLLMNIDSEAMLSTAVATIFSIEKFKIPYSIYVSVLYYYYPSSLIIHSFQLNKSRKKKFIF